MTETAKKCMKWITEISALYHTLIKEGPQAVHVPYIGSRLGDGLIFEVPVLNLDINEHPGKFYRSYIDYSKFGLHKRAIWYAFFKGSYTWTHIEVNIISCRKLSPKVGSGSIFHTKPSYTRARYMWLYLTKPGICDPCAIRVMCVLVPQVKNVEVEVLSYLCQRTHRTVNLCRRLLRLTIS